MSRHHSELEIIYDILDALQRGPLMYKDLKFRAKLNGAGRRVLKRLTSGGFVAHHYESRRRIGNNVNAYNRRLLEAPRPPGHGFRHIHAITPKGMALLIAIRKAKVMLGG